MIIVNITITIEFRICENILKHIFPRVTGQPNYQLLKGVLDNKTQVQLIYLQIKMILYYMIAVSRNNNYY